MPKLNEQLRRYREGSVDRESIVNGIILFLYEHPVLQRLYDLDQLHDFLVDLYPRVDGLVDRFELGDRPLEAYLVRMARFHVRTFGRRRNQKFRRDHMIVDFAKTENMTPEDHEETFDLQVLDWPWSPADRQRVLFLALRSAPDLSLPQMKALSEFAGTSLDTLYRWVDALRNHCQDRKDRKARERGKLDRSFARLLGYSYEDVSPDQQSRLSRQRGLVAEQRKRYLAYDCSCSHRTIAEVTGTSKGTVDSAIYHIKRKIREFQSHDSLERVSERA